MNSSEIDVRIEAAKRAVLSQTELMHREFGRARTQIKHDGTKVTAIDIAISQNIQALIGAEFPDDQFFSEELAPSEEPVPVTSRFCWVLDPIDGTNNYAAGIMYCAISLGLLEDGIPIYGVIYDMGRKTLIQGGPGRGVWDGEKPVRARTDLPDGYSLIGFHSPVNKSHAVEGKRLIENFKIRGLGSSTLHLAYLAIGLLDGVVEYNNKMWDIAAACALCAEAGVKIHYLEHSPFPLLEFTVKSPRVQYAAGNEMMCAKLLEILRLGSG